MPFVTGKMALRVWNLLQDQFDHDQWANNLFKIDLHDHTPGRGVQVPTEGIADAAITQSKLASGVTATPPDGSVTFDKIADGALAFSKFPVSQMVNGRVGSGGAITAGTGFSAVRNSAGNYTVTYTSSFGSIPVVLANPINASTVGVITASSTSAMTITTSVGGVATDAPFNFLAMAVV